MIKSTITFCFLLLTFFAQAQSVESLIESGNNNIKAKKFEAAIADFKAVLQQNSSDSKALNGVIRACTLSEEFKEAQKYIDIAIELYPENPEFVLRHGILLNFKGFSQDAIEQFARGLEMNPDEKLKIQFLMNKASAELNSDNYVDAIEDYSNVIELNPRSTIVYSCRGLANYRAGNLQEAVDDYTYALDLEPGQALAYYNRALALLKMEDKQRACADLQRACKSQVPDACKRIVLECKRR